MPDEVLGFVTVSVRELGVTMNDQPWQGNMQGHLSRKEDKVGKEVGAVVDVRKRQNSARSVIAKAEDGHGEVGGSRGRGVWSSTIEDSRTNLTD